MNTYQEILEIFTHDSLQYNSVYRLKEWGNKEIAERYLKKYWLNDVEYKQVWQPIQDKIFINQDQALPEPVFNGTFQLVAIRGGILFEQSDFELLQKCFLEVGDQYFVIIQNPAKQVFDAPLLRMKYPSSITWDELMNGDGVSSMLLGFPGNEYFVFGETDAWGKYSANDYELPLDIIGFKPEYSSIFKPAFKLPDEEWNEIKKWLPPLYKDKIDNK